MAEREAEMSAPIDLLLSKLDGVKRTGQSRWIARCPAHEDRSPSLAARELDDGRILLHCFAGCDVLSIVSAVGLELSDLFPPRDLGHHCPPERRPFPAADVLRCIGFEALITAAAGASLLSGHPFTETDRERLTLAVGRIQSALSAAGVSYD
jgi:hypothetical protein